MTIDEIVALAERVHNDEGHNLGASSTRESRNDYWERVVGMVHHGHPKYNATPDSRWHIKRASESRPPSDDVVVLMPERVFWDCIGGAGADGYTFRPNFDGPLPGDQIVYAPRVPVGAVSAPGGGASSGGGGTPPTPAPPAPVPGPDYTAKLDTLLEAVAVLRSRVDAVSEKLDVIRNDASIAAHESLNAAVRASDIKTQIDNLPTPGSPTSFPAYEGRVFGSKVRLEPK